MKNGTLSKIAKTRFAQALNGTGSFPVIKMAAIGDGGINGDGDVRIALPEDISLHHELLRKEITAVTPLNESRYRYEIIIEKEELPGQEISELALIDDEGNIFYTECFSPKVHYEYTEKVFEIDIEFY